MDANPSEVTALDVFLLFSAKTAIQVFGDAAAASAAGRILETWQAPIHHAPGPRYIAEETPCSDFQNSHTHTRQCFETKLHNSALIKSFWLIFECKILTFRGPGPYEAQQIQAPIGGGNRKM